MSFAESLAAGAAEDCEDFDVMFYGCERILLRPSSFRIILGTVRSDGVDGILVIAWNNRIGHPFESERGGRATDAFRSGFLNRGACGPAGHFRCYDQEMVGWRQRLTFDQLVIEPKIQVLPNVSTVGLGPSQMSRPQRQFVEPFRRGG